MIGCSGSFPGPDSPASCYLVEADGFRLVLDMGNGSLGALQRHIDVYSVDAVLLSHLHVDHCIDLCSYYVARKYRPQGPLPPVAVHGPAGTQQRMAAAYDLGDGEDMSGEFDFHSWRAGTAYDIGPFRVTVDQVNHPVETYGMRLEHGGRTLAYSGDSAESAALAALARDADIFLCEASFHDGRDDGVKGLHLTGRTAAEHATEAGARRLVLTHIPPWNDAQRTLTEARTAYAGPVELASPGATYDV